MGLDPFEKELQKKFSEKLDSKFDDELWQKIYGQPKKNWGFRPISLGLATAFSVILLISVNWFNQGINQNMTFGEEIKIVENELMIDNLDFFLAFEDINLSQEEWDILTEDLDDDLSGAGKDGA